MRLNQHLGRVAVLCALTAGGPAGAGDFEAGLYTGLVVPGPNHELYEPVNLPRRLSPGPALGGRFSYRPFHFLAAEVEAHGAYAAVQESGGALLYAYRGQAVVLPPIDLPADIEPFLTAGLGNFGLASAADALGTDLDWAAHAGVGGRVPLTDVLALRADFRLMFADRNVPLGTVGGHSELLVGVSYHLGPPGDEDDDGILDRADACRTESEIVNGYVDTDGCPDALAALSVRIVDTEGLPAVGITVSRDGSEVGRTDLEGRLALDGLMPETSVVVRGEHFHMERPEEATVALTSGANQADLVMAWLPGRVRVVTVADNKPMLQAIATFSGPKQLGPSPIDQGDQVFFLAPGNWQTLVEAETYGTELVELTIAPDERSLVRIEMHLEPARVQVTREEVVILQQILFETGSTDIQGGSLDLVKEVTATILTNPHIKKIQIQGHTDSRGPATLNRTLSQGRVESVMAWMVKHGVAAEVLEAKGFGEDKPVGSNDTPEGQALNRRVVFAILEQDLQVDAP